MDLIDRTNFTADTKKFIEDTEVAKMEIVDPTIKQKIEKKKQISIDNLSNLYQNQVGHENSLMKKVKINNEFIKEKTRKRLEKRDQEQVKERMGEYYGEKKPFQKSSKSRKNNM